MKKRTISPPFGMEIHTGIDGHVCISRSYGDGALPLVILNRSEVAELIKHLQAAYDEPIRRLPPSLRQSTHA